MRTRLAVALILCSTGLGGSAGAALSTGIAWEREGTGSFDATGAAVGTAGDVNCDGYADLIVGIPQDDEVVCPSCIGTDSGTVEVWFGGANRPPQPDPLARPDWFTYTGSFAGNFGAAVAAGDVNGDGCDDVIASEPFPSTPLLSPQLVHVFLGPLAPVTQAPDAQVASPDLPEWSAALFTRVAPLVGGQQPASLAAGDVNGDGLADVIVGQPEASNGQSEEGVVLVWLGSQSFASDPDGTPANADWMAQSDQAGAHLGESVASAFDFNGDGRDDILAGAPEYDSTGWALVWLGSFAFESAADGTPGNKVWSLTLGDPGSRLGAAVATAGDFDGDGFGDVLVGAPLYDSFGTADAGEALLVRGGAPLPASDSFTFRFGTPYGGAQLGAAVATAGDVNGDGLADVLVGEPEIGDEDRARRGRVHLILGRRGVSGSFGLFPVDDATYTAPDTAGGAGGPARFGSALGTAGDWNGDGFSDVIVGAPRFGSNHPGKAFVFLGSGETLAFGAQAVTPNQPGAGHGLGLGFAGDIDHDGYADFVSGAPFYESHSFEESEGRLFVTYGDACGAAPFCGNRAPEPIVAGEREINQEGAQLGWSVAGAGDVNGDGYADVIAGAPTFDPQRLCTIPDPPYIALCHCLVPLPRRRPRTRLPRQRPGPGVRAHFRPGVPRDGRAVRLLRRGSR